MRDTCSRWQPACSVAWWDHAPQTRHARVCTCLAFWWSAAGEASLLSVLFARTLSPLSSYRTKSLLHADQVWDVHSELTRLFFTELYSYTEGPEFLMNRKCFEEDFRTHGEQRPALLGSSQPVS